MKVGIVTLQFHTNYGGILQAWALQEMLKRLGHEPILLRHPGYQAPWLFQPLAILRRAMLRARGCDVPLLARIHDARMERKISTFHRFRISKSPILADCGDRERFVRKSGICAVIAGSDQIWRPQFTESCFFLDFLEHLPDVRRIAYAASFGSDSVDYGPTLARYAELAKRFDAVSVRESSAIPVCRRLFGTNPRVVLDPTMLVPVAEYARLARRTEKDRLVAFFLSGSARKMDLIREVGNRTGLPPFVFPTTKDVADRLIPPALPSVEDWLGTILHSRCVLTDSFHGTVFSILFGKPFVSLDNGTGPGRIRSLLELFGMEERLLPDSPSPDEVARLIDKPLQEDLLRRKLEILSADSLEFLSTSLGHSSLQRNT